MNVVNATECIFSQRNVTGSWIFMDESRHNERMSVQGGQLTSSSIGRFVCKSPNINRHLQDQFKVFAQFDNGW